MSHFTIDLEDEVDLVLREPWTVDGMHALIAKNLDRLRKWEALRGQHQDRLTSHSGRAYPLLVAGTGRSATGAGTRGSAVRGRPRRGRPSAPRRVCCGR